MTSVSCSLRFAAQSPVRKYRLVQTGDIHQSYLAASRTKTLMDDLTQQGLADGRSVIRLNAGDTHTGQDPLRWELNHRLNLAMGFNVNTLGNHDTYMPAARFLEVLKRFPGRHYLMNNLDLRVPKAYGEVIQKGLVRVLPEIHLLANEACVGVLGISGPNGDKPLRKHSKPLSAHGTLQALKQGAAFLKKTTEKWPVILASHMGLDWDQPFARSKDSQQIDVVAGGHTHVAVQGLKEGETLFTHDKGHQVVVTNAGAFGEYVVSLDFDQTPDGKIHFLENRLVPVNSTIPRAPQIDTLIQEYFPSLESLISIVPSGVSPDEERRRQLYFLANAAKKQGNAQIGMVRSNEFRRTLVHEVSAPVEMVISLPYREPLSVVRYTGRHIREAMEISLDPKAWPWIMPDGLRWKQESDLPGVLEVETRPDRWEPLQDDTAYTVAICDYMATAPEKVFPSLNKTGEVLKTMPGTMGTVMADALKGLGKKTVQFGPLPAHLQHYKENKAV